MTEDFEDCRVVIDFVDHNGAEERWIFAKPKKVMIAERIDQVMDALRDVESWVSDGNYAAGYISYEAAPAFDQRLAVKTNARMPLLWFGIFSEPSKEPAPLPASDRAFDLQWTHLTRKEDYVHRVREIQELIESGKTDQVNYTMRLRAEGIADDFLYYETMRRAQQPKYGAYLNTGRFRILSASPELFFAMDRGHIEVRPMKGTIQRGRWLEEDEARREQLRQSKKDQAENRMIVDLMRSELQKISKPGSIEVPALFDIETYPTVHQMTSTVTGELLEGIQVRDVFQALFPCGSVTGTPKERTMEIIAGAEEDPREVYCGSIGYISPHHQAVFNVAIRTAVVDAEKQTIQYGTGGGITRESDPESEYQEALTKAAILYEPYPPFELMETIRYEKGEYFLLDLHLKRLGRSSLYFDIPFNGEACLEALQRYREVLPQAGILRVNVYVDQSGQIRLKSTPFEGTAAVRRAELASTPISRNQVFLYHKTTNRRLYEERSKGRGALQETLLWNEERELTEFTIGNLVVKMDGEYWTPPIDCGLLPGTFREHLLMSYRVKEKVLAIDDIHAFEEIWMVNSLRGWVRIELPFHAQNPEE